MFQNLARFLLYSSIPLIFLSLSVICDEGVYNMAGGKIPTVSYRPELLCAQGHSHAGTETVVFV